MDVRFIKLHACANNEPAYIRTDQILAFVRINNKTVIKMAYIEQAEEVIETPEEILRLIAETQD